MIMYERIAIMVLFGVPALAAIIVGIYFWLKDHKIAPKHA